MHLRICIVALNAWPAVQPSGGRIVGGIETNAWTLARGLAADHSTEVSLVVRRTRSVPNNQIEGVTILPIIERLRDLRRRVSQTVQLKRRFPWIRPLCWNFELLWAIPLLALARPFHRRSPPSARLLECLLRADADVYVAYGNGRDTATVMQAAAQLQRSGVLWLQANADIQDRVFDEPDSVNEYGEPATDCRSALETASAIISQTKWQQDQFQKHTGRSSVLIPNPIDLSAWNCEPRTELSGEFVLWVGRFDRFHKRPHLCLDITRKCPDIPFKLVINGGDPEVESTIRAACPPNVEIIDYVPRDQMPNVFRQARLFLSTGAPEFEGFPNVLLEAAATGTPIVSLDNFDSFFDRSSAGRCGEANLDSTVTHVQALWNNPDSWLECSRAGQKFVHDQHSVDAVSTDVREFLVRCIENCGTWNDG
jgi:glycosyltransferase involved in cell wall biosynthesis